jgi:hypothetical protein
MHLRLSGVTLDVLSAMGKEKETRRADILGCPETGQTKTARADNNVCPPVIIPKVYTIVNR